MDNQIETPKEFTRAEEQAMLAEMLENSRKAKNFMKWQLIITVALVVIPLVGMLAIIPSMLGSLTSLYGGALQ